MNLRDIARAYGDDLIQKQSLQRQADISDESYKKKLQFQEDLKRRSQQQKFKDNLKQYQTVKNMYNVPQKADMPLEQTSDYGQQDQQQMGMPEVNNGESKYNFQEQKNIMNSAKGNFYKKLADGNIQKAQKLSQELEVTQKEVESIRQKMQVTGGTVKEMFKSDLMVAEKKMEKIEKKRDAELAEAKKMTIKMQESEIKALDDNKQANAQKVYQAYTDSNAKLGKPNTISYMDAKTNENMFAKVMEAISQNNVELDKEPAKADKGKVETAVETESEKRIDLTQKQLGRVKGLLQGSMINYNRSMKQKQEMGIPEGTLGHRGATLLNDLENAAPKIFKTMTKKLYGEEKSLTAIKTTDAQAMEVILSLSPILTGSTRVMASVLGMLNVTIPEGGFSREQYQDLVAQTYANSYKLTKAYAKKGISEEELAKMSEDEQIRFFQDAFTGTSLTNEEEESLLDDLGDILNPPEKTDFFKRMPRTPEEAKARRVRRLKEKLSQISPDKLAKLRAMKEKGEL